ncbi:alpha/beta hydrolase family protein [Streptomyces sp. NPDC001985]|uniref:alpha/beta hydrolase n=1 Tax=Streptomyces sp. NPDC001985 TaxID=3154406 RepID=UPI00332E17FE
MIVFVHGVGGPRDPDASRQSWTSALAEGARAAGHSAAISGLTGGWDVETVFAHYEELFHPDSGAEPQGAGGVVDAADRLDEEQARITLALMGEFLEREAERPENRGDARLARARAQLSPEALAGAEAQGLLGTARHVIDACSLFASLPLARRLARWATAHEALRDWSQPGRYLARHAENGHTTPLDQRIRERVRSFLDPERPTIVIGHSLGSVIALETLADGYPGEVPLFVTIGSPIATRAVVWPRLRPSPPTTPACVGRWLDFADRDDLIVPRHPFDDIVLPNEAGVRPESVPLDSCRLWVHSATTYLRRPEPAGAVMEALASLSAAS